MHRCRPARVGPISDLVLHMGEVHRWATAAVASKATEAQRGPWRFASAHFRSPPRQPTGSPRRRHAVRRPWSTADPSVEYAAFLADPADAAPVVLGTPPGDGDDCAPRRRRVGTRSLHAAGARHRARRDRRVPHRFPASVAHAAARRRRRTACRSRPTTASSDGPCRSATTCR